MMTGLKCTNLASPIQLQTLMLLASHSTLISAVCWGRIAGTALLGRIADMAIWNGKLEGTTQ